MHLNAVPQKEKKKKGNGYSYFFYIICSLIFNSLHGGPALAPHFIFHWNIKPVIPWFSWRTQKRRTCQLLAFLLKRTAKSNFIPRFSFSWIFFSCLSSTGITRKQTPIRISGHFNCFFSILL